MTGRKRLMYGLSSVLVIISIVSLSIFSLKTGVDFKGGHQFRIEFAKDFRDGAV